MSEATCGSNSPPIASAVPGYRSAHPGYDSSVYPFSDATPSISISIFGSGSATTTQVVRAG